MRQLHQNVASHLGVQPVIDQADSNECKCKLAAKLARDPPALEKVNVIHGKSQVDHLTVTTPTEAGIKQLLRQSFGNDYETKKKVVFHGGVIDDISRSVFKRTPAIAICSKQRHIPAHARQDDDDGISHTINKVLDLHSIECPIHPACFDSTLLECGVPQLAENGTVTIFAVMRSKSATEATMVGKNAIFRARAHWTPSVKQSDRGTAMFLSTSRVGVSLIEDMKDDEKAQDAILRVLDLLTSFPPALRTMFILVQGNSQPIRVCGSRTCDM